MNAFEKFIAAHPGGYIRDTDVSELAKLSRLCACVVRCGKVRFTCGAQYVAEMVKMVEASGDYVRDVSISAGEIERAGKWIVEPDFSALNRAADAKLEAGVKIVKAIVPRRVCGADFSESDCGGVFDGFGVVSDADPGL